MSVATARHLDPARLEGADTLTLREPFALLIAKQQLDPARSADYARDFPRYTGAGFFPYAAADCGPSMQALVDELHGPEFARAIGERLGVERLDQYPTLVTLCRSLNARHGNIHTDSLSKVVTALLYLNPEWPHGSAGSLRFLANLHDMDALVAPELPPLYGHLAAFRRSDCSFHGHPPFEGERHVIQVAWLVDEHALHRKTRRGRLSRFVKWVFGRLDKRWR
jgi:hypothetical protein